MKRLIMDMPLMISAAIRHAVDHHGKTEVVRAIEGDIHRCDHATAHARVSEFAARPGSSQSAPDCCVGPSFAAAPP